MCIRDRLGDAKLMSAVELVERMSEKKRDDAYDAIITSLVEASLKGKASPASDELLKALSLIHIFIRLPGTGGGARLGFPAPQTKTVSYTHL